MSHHITGNYPTPPTGGAVPYAPASRVLDSYDAITSEISNLNDLAASLYWNHDNSANIRIFSSLSDETKNELYFWVWVGDGCPKLLDYGRNQIHNNPHKLRIDQPFLVPNRGDLLQQMIHLLECRRDYIPIQETRKAAYRCILSHPFLSHEVKERCYLKLDVKSRSEVEAPIRGLLHTELGSFYNGYTKSTKFSVQAPNARAVNVVMTYDGRECRRMEMGRNPELGYWETSLDGVSPGSTYYYEIIAHDGNVLKKIDPFACEQTESHTDYFHYESVVRDPLSMHWSDDEWMGRRAEAVGKTLPMSSVGINLNSWNPGITSYAKLAEEIASYCEFMGYTHVTLSGLLEHPNMASGGYQPLSLCAPTTRLGTIHDFQNLVNTLHRRNIGVGIDFIPNHFVRDSFGLCSYDGTNIFEHYPPILDWDAFKFNYDNPFVRNYAISSAKFWADMHIDFFRVDAVDPLIDSGFGENPSASYFIRSLNEYLHQSHPGILTFAEGAKYSDIYTRPTGFGGYGFDGQLDLGRQHDIQQYLREDFAYRGDHHDELVRAPSSIAGKAVCALSHDHDLRPDALAGGDIWRKYANARILRCFQMLTPGKKSTFAEHQWESGDELPLGLLKMVSALNHLYRSSPSLYESDETSALRWIETKDKVNSVVSFHRGNLACVFNLKPDCFETYEIHFPEGDDRSRISSMREVFSSDAAEFGGSGKTNSYISLLKEGDRTVGFRIQLPPLGCAVFEESF